MTREEAIQLLVEKIDYLQSFINCAADPETSYPNSIKFCEALGMAISALREQEELARNLHGIETACEYCNGSGKHFLVDDDIPFGSYNSIRLVGDKSFLDDADGFSIRIKFCPMCGRRLEEV